MLIKNAYVALENESSFCDIRIKDDRIFSIRPEIKEEKGEEVLECKDKILMPGVVDLHTHGSGGHDFMDGDISSVEGASLSLLRNGTTSFLPTSLTSSDEDLFLFLDNVREAKKRNKGGRILGVHLEGPYFSPLMSGAQDAKNMVLPNPSHYEKILERGEGLIKRWSLAPEVPGALELIERLRKDGILVSGAHSDGEYKDAKKAFECGMSMLTHFYSGMSALKRVGGRRVLGLIESGYLIDDLYLELIADGMHLPPDLLTMIFKLKDKSRITCCSDSMRGAGMGDGPSVLGPKKNGLEVIVENGVAKVLDRSCYAGSVATGERLVFTLIKTMGLKPHEAATLLSLNPSSLIGEGKEIGSIKEGKKADILVFGKEMKLEKVIFDGKIVEGEDK